MIRLSVSVLVFILPSFALTAAPTAPSRLGYDFNAENPWTAAAPVTTSEVTADLSWEPVGTFDTRDSADQSPALRLRVDAAGGNKTWRAGFRSGPLPVALAENDLAKLTLAFDLSASAALPVHVTITSLDADGQPTGALQGTVDAAAPDFIHRHTLDLSTLTPLGAGNFQPDAPAIELSFDLAGAEWPMGQHELRVDNVALAGPAFYVAPDGSDNNDGRTEATAFATPQRAVDAAGPGDIILLRQGTYDGGEQHVVSFVRGGTPAAWIVLKNHPGERPTLRSNAWNIVNIGRGSKSERSTAPALAYLELRGLHVRGDGDTLEKTHPELLNEAVARINSNGIAVDGRYEANPPHHLRFADNLVEYAPAQGVGFLEADWVFFERNLLRYNSWTTIYATSGISTMGSSNFDGVSGIYKILIRDNISHGNETRYMWRDQGKYSDGNGIILDLNIKPVDRPDIRYIGRTLVQNNLVFNNGGSGIHCVGAAHVDIINNTAYFNSASPHLHYGQIYASWESDDVRIINNIMVARVADVEADEKPYPLNPATGNPTNIVYRNNLYFGGNTKPTLGKGDRVGDPRFVNPSIEGSSADFRLRPGSPAIGAGAVEPFGPYRDLAGQARETPPTIGAYEK